jgi:acyl carrier protein
VTTYQDVRQTIVTTLTTEGRPAAGIVVGVDTPLAEGGLELTSLGLVRALVTLEDTLGVELDDAVVMTAEFRTVSDVTEAIMRILDSAPAS